jgi:hypothetical protein
MKSAPTPAVAACAARPAIYYDFNMPQLQFAAREAGSQFLHYGIGDWDPTRAPQHSPSFVVQIQPGSTAPQGYELGGGDRVYTVSAGDADGAMYGTLAVTEAYRLGLDPAALAGQYAPHVAQRGLKINIPLDARTPSYSDPADAAQENIAEMWSLEFWLSLFDEMARCRLNVISLWSLHPFPSLVRVPEFPDVALDDVVRTTHPFDDSYSFQGVGYVRPEILANSEVVRHITMDGKIDFWRAVMQCAKDRGIQTYLFTWNIFTYGATGKHGITDEQDNETTIEYMRASVRETILTYPLLAGIGITAGEHMNDAFEGPHSREAWLWRTYGEGVRDALRVQPKRAVTLIHRYHQSDPPAEVAARWGDYPGEFAFSFKYSGAHMLSIPNPQFIQPFLRDLPAGQRTWLTIRNDDVCSFRWGDPAYVRAYISALPPREKMVGFYIGPDGDTWGREVIAKRPSIPRELVLRKHWFFFFLWGRLSYEPGLPPELIERKVAAHFGGIDGGALCVAWAAASQVFPLITRFFWDVSDVRWYPEGCLSHPRYKGYYTVRHFIQGMTMPGSGVHNILEWRRRKSASTALPGAGPIEIATALQCSSETALCRASELKEAIRDGAAGELRATLCDIEAMAHLAAYYALKIRGAAALALYDRSGAPEEQAAAIAHLEGAVGAWQRYADAYAAQYTAPHLYNRVGVVDIPALVGKAREDVTIAREWKPGTVPGDTVAPDPAARLEPDAGGNRHRVVLS